MATIPPDASIPIRPERALLRCLPALLQDRAALVRATLARYRLSEADATWLWAQGLAPYLYFALQSHDLLSLLPPETQALLQASYQQGALLEALQHTGLQSILEVLAQRGIESILLKGGALAHTVYPNPRCRLKSDLDLWVQPKDLPSALEGLQQIGYVPIHHERRPLEFKLRYDGEQQLRRPGWSGLIELQWPAIRGEWARRTTRIDHEGIWTRRKPLVLDGCMTTVMAPEDMLIHLCWHQAISHQFGAPWLRSLLDIHLLLGKESLSWPTVVERAQQWQLATTVWVMLGLTRQLLGTAIPDAVGKQLAPPYPQRRLIESLRFDRLMSGGYRTGYTYRRFLIQLSLIDRPYALLHLLVRTLFPEEAWLQARYGEPDRPLWQLRLWYLAHFLRSSQA